MPGSRTLRVAAVQVESHNGAIAANLARATPHVADAAARGAQLVLCPEFLAAGYRYDESIWESGERRGGPTESWLTVTAREHGVYVGASYLEGDGEDFFNTFTLVAPDGGVAGRVRKESLPAFEGWYFKSCDGPKVIATDLGRIAVGICQDNHTARFMQRLRDDDVDLLLMPHSAPCIPWPIIDPLMRENLREVPSFYARSFGVPAILVNKVGSQSRTPVPGLPLASLPFDFPGLSAVADSNGRVVARVHEGEGAAVADVLLDPARKRHPEIPTGYWSNPPSSFARLAGGFFTLFEALGKRAYANNPRRAAAARAVSRKEPEEAEKTEAVRA